MALTCDELETLVAHDRYKVKEAFAAHYKAERDRSEKCLGEILVIICGAADDASKLIAVAEAMTRHYSRS